MAGFDGRGDVGVAVVVPPFPGGAGGGRPTLLSVPAAAASFAVAVVVLGAVALVAGTAAGVDVVAVEKRCKSKKC